LLEYPLFDGSAVWKRLRIGIGFAALRGHVCLKDDPSLSTAESKVNLKQLGSFLHPFYNDIDEEGCKPALTIYLCRAKGALAWLMHEGFLLINKLKRLMKDRSPDAAPIQIKN